MAFALSFVQLGFGGKLHNGFRASGSKLAGGGFVVSSAAGREQRVLDALWLMRRAGPHATSQKVLKGRIPNCIKNVESSSDTEPLFPLDGTRSWLNDS